MDREGFRNRLKQYKKARRLNPLLKYWEWKARPAEEETPKYEEGTGNVQSANIPLWRQKATPELLEAFWTGDTQKMADIAEKQNQQVTYISPEYTLDEVVVTAKDPNKYTEWDLAKDIASFTPGLGDAMDVYELGKSVYDGNYSLAAMYGMGLLLPNWLEKSGKLLKRIWMGPSKAEKLGRVLSNSDIAVPQISIQPNNIVYQSPIKEKVKTISYGKAKTLASDFVTGSPYENIMGKVVSVDRGPWKSKTGVTGDLFGKYIGNGSESTVFMANDDPNFVYKILTANVPTPLDAKDYLSVIYSNRNKVPAALQHKLIGFVKNDKGFNPVMRLKRVSVLDQKDNKTLLEKALPQIDKKMNRSGYNRYADTQYFNDKNNIDILDIKPENVGQLENGNYTLLDFIYLLRAEQIPIKSIASDIFSKWGKSYAEGGEVSDNADYRQQIINRADYVASNYDNAKDFDLNPLVYTFRKFAKDNFDRGGISNCTLSATGWIDPNNQYMSAKNIFNNPSSGYTKVDAEYALPGDLLITKNPEKNSYHTMLIEGFNGNEPILRYSRGGHDTKENLVTGRPLSKYHELDNKQGGNHTEDHYFRYNIPNEYWLPEVIVTPEKYQDGGEVTDPQVEVLPKEQWPSPEEMYEQVRLPFNDLPLENVFSPLDIALGTAYKAWPMVNNVFKNYGPTLGALMVGSDGTNMNKPLQQMLTKKLDPDVKEFYNDIVLPLNPNDKKYKQYFINLFGDIDIQIDPTSNMPVNFAADFNPITNDIRLNANYIQTPIHQLLEAHEYGHLVDKYLPHKASTQQELNQSLPVSKKPISKDSDTYRERQSTKREAEFKTFKKLKDAGKLQLKTARAKTKKYQEYLMNATDEEILELLGADTAYKKDYLAGNLDIDTLRKQMIYAPTIAAGIIIPTHLLDSDKKENA